MELATMNVGDPQLLRDFAHDHQLAVSETHDGWIHAREGGTVFKAPSEVAAA